MLISGYSGIPLDSIIDRSIIDLIVFTSTLISFVGQCHDCHVFNGYPCATYSWSSAESIRMYLFNKGWRGGTEARLARCMRKSGW